MLNVRENKRFFIAQILNYTYFFKINLYHAET